MKPDEGGGVCVGFLITKAGLLNDIFSPLFSPFFTSVSFFFFCTIYDASNYRSNFKQQHILTSVGRLGCGVLKFEAATIEFPSRTCAFFNPSIFKVTFTFFCSLFATLLGVVCSTLFGTLSSFFLSVFKTTTLLLAF